ncbi:hypothetical protein WICMUC_001034 [Wickerhamomyces mucosus]|uniref:Uncharacterized protein n=1 Tax=Wickerhamomyces mucosus TaxID=1378264 RepID=A0A9P8THW1_9ASCO|nr:hypothetical protein WICMUC_001034 [Wickerhamomyces mucosus]
MNDSIKANDHNKKFMINEVNCKLRGNDCMILKPKDEVTIKVTTGSSNTGVISLDFTTLLLKIQRTTTKPLDNAKVTFNHHNT